MGLGLLGLQFFGLNFVGNGFYSLGFSFFGYTNGTIRTFHGARTRAGGDPRVVAGIGEWRRDADAERVFAS